MIARAGIASRRRAEDLIFEGKVKVNGTVVTIPQHPVLLSGADKVRARSALRIHISACTSDDLRRMQSEGAHLICHKASMAQP